MSGSNDSSTGGYLAPYNLPLEDDALANVLQTFAAGLTGISPNLVRPRWQPQPPSMPPPTTNWISIGVVEIEAVDYPWQIHDPTGYQHLYRLEKLTVAISSYGPNAVGNASNFRDSLYICQNLAILATNGLKLRGTEDILYVPELINTQWVSRCDVRMSFMRIVERDYAILNINGAEVDLDYEGSFSGTGEVVVGPDPDGS